MTFAQPALKRTVLSELEVVSKTRTIQSATYKMAARRQLAARTAHAPPSCWRRRRWEYIGVWCTDRSIAKELRARGSFVTALIWTASRLLSPPTLRRTAVEFQWYRRAAVACVSSLWPPRFRSVPRRELQLRGGPKKGKPLTDYQRNRSSVRQ